MEGNDIETPDEFARALNALRRASDKSYRRLADECGLGGFNTIAGYCSGRHLPQLAVRAEFAALLTALGVPPGAPQKVWLDALRELPLRAGAQRRTRMESLSRSRGVPAR